MSNRDHRRDHVRHSKSAAHNPRHGSSVFARSSSPRRASSARNSQSPARSSHFSTPPSHLSQPRKRKHNNSVDSDSEEHDTDLGSDDEAALERLSKDPDRGAKRQKQWVALYFYLTEIDQLQ